MEIMLLDFSFFVISLILASLILAFYSLSPKWSHSNSDYGEDIAVIEIIRALKKSCPVQFSNEWKLLPQNLSSICSWSKNISFLSLKNSIQLYGATCAMTCSSMYAFSLISDVTKWGEWEPSQSAQNLMLQPFSNNDCDLKKDHFMQVNEITSIQKGSDGQSYVAMYRFSSFPSKCTKWILFWNVKKIEFMFFLLQPATSRAVNIECTITHIYGSDNFSPDFPTLVSERLRNIKEFLFMSQLNIRPVGYSTPSPTPQSLSSEKELIQNNDSPSIILETENCDASNSVFVLVPLFQCLFLSMKRLKGFNLKLKKLGMKSQLEASKRKMGINKQSSKSEPLIADSVSTSIDSEKSNLFDDESHNDKIVKQIVSQNSDLLHGSVEKEIDKISIASEAIETINSQTLKSEKNSNIQSFSTTKLHSSSESVENVNKSVSVSQLTDLIEEENQKYILFTDESGKVWDRSELFCSSASDFEIIENVNQQFKDTTMAGYLTQGNYGASVLQTEMMLASQFDRTLHSGNRVAGGWIHLSTHKGIPVLTKSIVGKIMKILSFLCQIEIPANYKDIWKCVKNPRFRFMLDETVKTVEIIDRISDSQKLIHVYHETSGIIRKESIDFCLLQTEREEQNSFYSVFQSIESEKCPFMSAVTRGSLKPSGWIVQNLTPKSCKVTYLIQIFVNSSDCMLIQELNSLVPQSLHNLKQYIISKPK